MRGARPSYSDIRIMLLKTAIANSERWMNFNSSLVDGTEIDATQRLRVAASLFHLCIEHQQAVHTLVNHGLFGSAFALLRPQFEAYVRGIWYHRCATEPNIDAFIRGSEPPKIGEMLTSIETLPDFDSQSLIATKKAVWKALNEFTHGGAVQVKSRMNSSEIILNYKEEHTVGMLRWSVILSLLASTGISSLAKRDLLANQLFDEFRSIYAEDLLPFPTR
ncbi:MAG: hypothetical protein KGO49_13065 [Gammaproteobacteria bacterium]|nr:hypothetical protein [Gammaproteobacteria bacterium]